LFDVSLADPLAGTGGVRVGTGQLCGCVNRRRFGFWDDGDGAEVAGRRLTRCVGERVFAGCFD